MTPRTLTCQECGGLLPFPDKQPYNAQMCDCCDWVWRRPGVGEGDDVPVWATGVVWDEWLRCKIRTILDLRGGKLLRPSYRSKRVGEGHA